MNYQNFLPSKYLNAIDLDGLEEAPFTMRELREEEVQNPDGSAEQKPVLRFELDFGHSGRPTLTNAPHERNLLINNEIELGDLYVST